MTVIVQKFGGSSVATEERIRLVARRLAEVRAGGKRIVAVVSAMGSTTNELLGLAKRLAPDPARRELDMLLSSGERISMSLLAMTLQQMGIDAISLTGPQAGIVTSDEHFNAEILEVSPARIREELEAGKIVVVAGYQGMNRAGEVTTLGRGGSDTTAVALAAALDAEACEIYSDVDGIYTADPRVVPGARRIDRIRHDEMLALARCGAKVLSPRAIEYASRSGLPVRALCTFDRKPGTLVCASDSTASSAALGHEPGVAGVAGHDGVLWVRARGTRDLAAVREMVGAGLFLEAEASRGERDLLVASAQLSDPPAVAAALRERFGNGLTRVTGLGSVSVVGGDCPTGERVRAMLREAGIAVAAAYTEPIATTCLVDAEKVARALGVLHDALVDGGSRQPDEVEGAA